MKHLVVGIFRVCQQFIQGPTANLQLESALAGTIVLLFLGFRLMTWLPHSTAWSSGALRAFGGLLFAASMMLAILGGGFGLLAWCGSYYAADVTADQINEVVDRVSDAGIIGAVAGFILGLTLIYFITRSVMPRYVATLEAKTRRVRQDGLTDARTVVQQLPEAISYDARPYIQASLRHDHVFLGLDLKKKPVSIAMREICETHIHLVGPTRTGKGKVCQVILTQAVMRGNTTIVFDPKVGGDKWLASALYAVCQEIGVPFRYADLTAQVPHINPMRNVTGREAMQLVTTAFRLGRQGESADYYRVLERALVRQVSGGPSGPPRSLPDLADRLREAAGDEVEKVLGLLEQVNEVADIVAVQTEEGIDIEAALEQGGVLYIAGSDCDEDVLVLQVMLVLRMVQLIRKRERDTGRQVTVLLDEIKYLLSEPVLHAFSLIADRNCNLIASHQALKDLVCVDADREVTEGVVKTNCTVRLCFRQTDPETVEWIEHQTGHILVDSESREVVRNAALSEIAHETRRITQVPRSTIDGNMIRQLPPGCAVLIGLGVARPVFIASIKATRRVFAPTPAARRTRRQATSAELLRRDDGKVADTGGDGLL